MKFWTRARKGEMYPELQKAEREGRLEEAAEEIARRYRRQTEEIIRVYERTKPTLMTQR